MTGNTLKQFLDDVLTMGGPEKEFSFRGKRYFLESQPYDKDPNQSELVVFQCFGNEEYIFRAHGKDLKECYDQFVKAKIFDGLTIYEAEQEIEAIFG